MTKIDVLEAEAGPELDAACARKLGFKLIRMVRGWTRSMMVVDGHVSHSLPHYSEHIIAAWGLGAAVEDMGTYLTALITVINHDRGLTPNDFEIGCSGMNWVLTDEDVWALVHATPHQRARAFLLANGIKELEVGDDDD